MIIDFESASRMAEDYSIERRRRISESVNSMEYIRYLATEQEKERLKREKELIEEIAADQKRKQKEIKKAKVKSKISRFINGT